MAIMSPTANLLSKGPRHSLRYQGFDYTSAGAYFVTICTRHGKCLFGDIVPQEMILNDVGEIANACWLTIPDHYPQVKLDEFVVMPNHMHGILWIMDDITASVEARGGTMHCATTGFNRATHDPVVREFGKPIPGSLSTIIGVYKAAVSREVNNSQLLPDHMRWHRNF
jgi:hypothetical protein